MKEKREKKNRRRHKFIEILKNIRPLQIVVLLVVTVLVGGIMLLNCYRMYDSRKTALTYEGKDIAVHIGHGIDTYIQNGINSVDVLAYTLDNLFGDEYSDDEIQDFIGMELETLNYSMDGACSDIKLVRNGLYYRGGMYSSDVGLAANEKWYNKAIEADGEAVLISPVRSFKNVSEYFSISRMLSDGEGVICVDLMLDKLQDLMLSDDKSIERWTMVIGIDGDVISHSKQDEIGLEYSEDNGSMGSIIYKTINSIEPDINGGYSFEVDFENMTYMVYAQNVNGQWYSVSCVGMQQAVEQLGTIYIWGMVIPIIVFLLGMVFLFIMSARKLRNEELDSMLMAVGSIYRSVFLIDLETDSIEILRSNEPEVVKILSDNKRSVKDRLNECARVMTAEENMDESEAFLNLETLSVRLHETDTIETRILDVNYLWCGGRFIVVDRYPDGAPKRIMWVVSVIDKEKRERDKLIYLSQTDQMTRVYNRVSGENKITGMLDAGYGGMFVMVDVDDFKNVNDTYGHAKGDRVLIEVAKCLKRTFREDDIVLRYGGDEFSAFAPLVYDKKDGEPIIRRLIENLDNINVAGVDKASVSASIGVAFCAGGERITYAELSQIADKNLYESKKHSGNYATYGGES